MASLCFALRYAFAERNAHKRHARHTEHTDFLLFRSNKNKIQNNSTENSKTVDVETVSGPGGKREAEGIKTIGIEVRGSS